MLHCDLIKFCSEIIYQNIVIIIVIFSFLHFDEIQIQIVINVDIDTFIRFPAHSVPNDRRMDYLDCKQLHLNPCNKSATLAFKATISQIKHLIKCNCNNRPYRHFECNLAKSCHQTMFNVIPFTDQYALNQQSQKCFISNTSVTFSSGIFNTKNFLQDCL